MSKEEQKYMSLVRKYNDFIYSKANTNSDSQFEQVKEELLEFVNRFLEHSQKEQVFADSYKKRKYEDKEKISARLLHNINQKLPIDEIDCQNVFFEYRLMVATPWGSWVTVPQAFIIACIVMIGIWFFFCR